MTNTQTPLWEVSLSFPAAQEHLLVLRLTTAGVSARAQLDMEGVEDVKAAAGELCHCMFNVGAAGQAIAVFTCFEDGLNLCMRFALDQEQIGEEAAASLYVTKNIVEDMVDALHMEQKTPSEYVVQLYKRIAH